MWVYHQTPIRHEKESSSIDNISNVIGTLISLFSDMFMYSGVIIAGMFLINRGEITFGTLMLFLQLCTCITFLFSAITDYFINYQDMLNAVDRLDVFFKKYSKDNTYKNDIKYSDWKKRDSFELRCCVNAFAYEDKNILEKIYFTLKDKEVLKILGKNGSGKSTLAKIILNQRALNNGHVALNGVPISEIPPSILPTLIGYVPQTIDFIHGSVLDNIELGYYAYDKKLLDRLLQLTDLDKMISLMPQKIHTIIESKGNNLSSGQKQRVAFIRALIRTPLILILDEFDANIENSLYDKIMSKIRSDFPELGIILINHNDDNLFDSKVVSVDS